jgi:hypothetical protein
VSAEEEAHDMGRKGGKKKDGWCAGCTVREQRREEEKKKAGSAPVALPVARTELRWAATQKVKIVSQ